MKKLFSILLTSTLALSTLVGCSTQAPPEANESNTPAPAATEKKEETPKEEPKEAEPENKELNIAIFEGGYGPTYWVEVVQKFEEAYPGVKVNMQINPKIGEIIRPQIVAGNVPDFISMNDTESSGLITAMIKENALMDITDLFEETAIGSDTKLKDLIMDGVLDTGKCAPYGDGKIYFAPFNASPMGLVYNKTLFEENNWELPVTWDEFFALGDKAKEKGIALFTYPGIYPGYVESMLFPSIASASGLDNLKAIASYTEGSFNQPEVLKVLENIQKISTDGYLMEGTVALNHTQSQTDMMMNKALFIPNGNWIEGEMKEAPRADGFQFGLCPAPVIDASQPKYVMSSIEQFSIPVNAKNPELAKEFIRFLYTDESVKAFAREANGIYALKGATELTKGIVTDGVYGMNEIYDNATSMVFSFDALPQNSKVNPRDTIFDVISDVMNGKMTPQQWAEGVEKAFAEVQANK